MTCKGVEGYYAIVDCKDCEGIGYYMQLNGISPPSKETCPTCKGTCLNRIPILDIPIIKQPIR